jgi:hypothetical protein
MEATCNLARLVATSDGSDEEVTPHCHTRLIPRAFSTCAYCIRQTKRHRLSLCPNPSLSEAHRAAEARDLGTPRATPNRRSDPTRALPGGPLSTPPYSGGHAPFPTFTTNAGGSERKPELPGQPIHPCELPTRPIQRFLRPGWRGPVPRLGPVRFSSPEHSRTRRPWSMPGQMVFEPSTLQR